MYGLWHKQIYEDPMTRHVKYLSFLCHRKMLYRTSSKHEKQSQSLDSLHSRAGPWHLDWLSICSFSVTDSYIYRLCNNGPEHFTFLWETGTEALSVEGTGKTLQGQKRNINPFERWIPALHRASPRPTIAREALLSTSLLLSLQLPHTWLLHYTMAIITTKPVCSPSPHPWEGE